MKNAPKLKRKQMRSRSEELEHLYNMFFMVMHNYDVYWDNYIDIENWDECIIEQEIMKLFTEHKHLLSKRLLRWKRKQHHEK